MGESEGLVKVLADKNTDRVLAVHIFGPRASDMIAEAVTVMEFGGKPRGHRPHLSRTPDGFGKLLKEAALRRG